MDEKQLFREKIFQIALATNAYLKLALVFMESHNNIIKGKNEKTKMLIYANNYVFFMRATAKSYADQAILNIVTLLYSNNKQEITIKKYDNKFNEKFYRLFIPVIYKCDKLKITNHRHNFTAHKNKKIKDPIILEIAGHNQEFIENLYKISEDILYIIRKEFREACFNNYFEDKIIKPGRDVAKYCVEKIKKEIGITGRKTQ